MIAAMTIRVMPGAMSVALAACLAGCGISPEPVDDPITLGDTPFGPVTTLRIADGRDAELTVLFDTGAGVTVVDETAVDESALQFLQTVNVASGGSGRVEETMYLADFVVAGRCEAAKQPLLVMNLRANGGPFVNGIDGIFGIKALAGAPVEIDFGGLRARRLDAPPDCDGHPFMRAPVRLPATTLRIDDHAITVVIDSGAGDFLTLPIDWAEKIELQSAPVEAGGVRGVAGETRVLEGSPVSAVSISGRSYDDVAISFAEDAAFGLIGMAALRDFVVTIDYENSQSWLRHRNAETTCE